MNTIMSAGTLGEITIPHFTTVIRWLTRIGYYLLKRPTRRICSANKPWVCIADHTIQVGTNKAFVVIGIPAKTLKSGKLLTLKDAVVLATVVKRSWTGENVGKVMKQVFKHNGLPLQIVIDGAYNLQKGVREALSELDHDCQGVREGLSELDHVCHVTYDITHFIAKLFKEKYNGGMKFDQMMKELAITSKQIAQTDIGYLIPPKIREKSRFLNLPNLAKWLEKLINIHHRAPLSGAEKKLIRKHFGWMWKPDMEAYIREFSREVNAIKDLQRILKNTGINDYSYQKAFAKLSEIEDDCFTEPIRNALDKELSHAQTVGIPLLMTSDLIESLFGKYKAIAKPHRLSEIGKSALSIPVICEEITLKLIDKVFGKTTGNEVDKWVKRNIPTTLLSRKAVVMKNSSNNVLTFPEFEKRSKRRRKNQDNGLKTVVFY
jgi:hypothetical protein